jgi:tRNA/tmRNA/rRNA uracil-C5-methylase (TrmA/RlmC/RlmD family)
MEVLTLDIEKPAAGGRMLARHQGQIVLVSGAIPGERVSARLERRERGVLVADAVDVLQPSADRRPVAGEPRCGGNVFSHIAYPRQLTLKSDIIQDAFRRIGRLPLPEVPVVTGSPERGYRMRARLHVIGGRIGFYREGTHQICDVAATGQLLPETSEWVAAVQRKFERQQLRGVVAIDLAENIPAAQRACHLELHAAEDPQKYVALSEGLVGLSAQRADRPAVVHLAGTTTVSDAISVGDEPSHTLTLSRDVRAFFQGNRFLVEELVRRVVGLVPRGPVVDLYAGVGLFGLSLAAAGRGPVTAVEGDTIAGADLSRNAAPFSGHVNTIRRSVESYAASMNATGVQGATVVVDPPRTGISRDAIAHLIRLLPTRIVYISCDVATLARDTRLLHDAGYGLEHLSGIDLFPNTAHVETVAVLSR